MRKMLVVLACLAFARVQAQGEIMTSSYDAVGAVCEEGGVRVALVLAIWADGPGFIASVDGVSQLSAAENYMLQCASGFLAKERWCLNGYTRASTETVTETSHRNRYVCRLA